MIDITHKSNTLRKAVALATVYVSDPAVMEVIREKKVPKGDIFEFSRAAGLLAIKKTSDLIPDCHPMPVEYASFAYELKPDAIVIRTEVHTIYKTGVEVEAMHGAMTAALTIYDMLKPLDKHLEIRSVKLEAKTGGKSAMAVPDVSGLKCAVVVCSDSVSSGVKEDVSGKLLVARLEGLQIRIADYSVVPDDREVIGRKLETCAAEGYDLVLFTGGTGLSSRDVTPDAVKPLLDREIPGLMEAARAYGQERTPRAMLSRGLAGFKDRTLVLTLPGSPAGAAETMDALFPAVLHVFKIRDGYGHD